jgi:formyltetrahydrofolate synthetase
MTSRHKFSPETFVLLSMRTMPGLSVHPAATRIDIDARGGIVGLL